MAYYVVVYDVEVSRVNKVKALLRQYLYWVQNSVFEGDLSAGKFLEMRERLERTIDVEKDSVVIYRFASKSLVEREVIGREKGWPPSEVI